MLRDQIHAGLGIFGPRGRGLPVVADRDYYYHRQGIRLVGVVFLNTAPADIVLADTVPVMGVVLVMRAALGVETVFVMDMVLVVSAVLVSTVPFLDAGARVAFTARNLW